MASDGSARREGTRPRFFATQGAFRAWLAKNHAKRQELLVGFRTVASRKESITWPQAVDEALCFGWIDGIRKNVDATSYSIRFTPRKPRSIWSTVNVTRARELLGAGAMMPAGRAAFEARTAARTSVYAYEQRDHPTLAPAFEREFRANKKAWAYFQAQAAGYRKIATWWVISAKREETRRKRLRELIRDSAAGRRIAQTIPRRPTRAE